MSKYVPQSGGFTPTPILVLFRFFKIPLLRVITLVQEFIPMKNDSETKKPHQNWCRGFTLVELLVTLGIFMIMTGVVLANYRTYNTGALFANASEDIVLALRQAQVYGVGAKGEGTIFTMPYGVHFDKTTPGQIIIFADRGVADGVYTAVNDNPILETIKWQNTAITMSVNCGGFACDGNGLNITFKRPAPDALIKNDAGVSYNNGSVTISSGTKTSTIVVTNTGQISLQ